MDESRCPISPSSEIEDFMHPMMRLQKRACDLSHIDFATAHAIDEVICVNTETYFHCARIIEGRKMPFLAF